MKVLDIILTALRYVGREDVVEVIEETEPDEEFDFDSEQEQVMETILCCFNSVEDELARCYIPLETEEKLSSENGVYNYADFSLRPVKIISVKSGGKPVKYSLTALSLITDCAEITVKYGYAPLKKGVLDDSEFSSVFANERLVAAGTASEFCLIEGEANLAQTWESVYRGEIESVQKTRLKELRLPPRRWV